MTWVRECLTKEMNRGEIWRAKMFKILSPLVENKQISENLEVPQCQPCGTWKNPGFLFIQSFCYIPLLL